VSSGDDAGDGLRIDILPDAGELARRGAEQVVSAARSAVARSGRAVLAFSGGSTPARMFAALAGESLPWSQIHVFQVDERVAPDGDPDRNIGQIRSALVERGVLPEANLHAMPVTAPDLRAAAAAYAEVLAASTGGVIDLVHLGLGDDGHTASWPPGDPVVDSESDVAVVGPYRGRVRMTVTPRLVNRATRILWLVSGADKAEALRRLVAGDPAVPASRVRRRGAVLLADRAAASLLSPANGPPGGR
jgi:6-phosphogluconolactonase